MTADCLLILISSNTHICIDLNYYHPLPLQKTPSEQSSMEKKKKKHTVPKHQVCEDIAQRSRINEKEYFWDSGSIFGILPRISNKQYQGYLAKICCLVTGAKVLKPQEHLKEYILIDFFLALLAQIPPKFLHLLIFIFPLLLFLLLLLLLLLLFINIAPHFGFLETRKVCS